MKTHKISVLLRWSAIQVLLLALLLTVALDLINMQWAVPFNYWGDTLWFATITKAVAENANPYFINTLSAPFGFPAASFPAITHFDWLIMLLLSALLREPGHILNAYWLISIVFTGLACFLSLILIGIRRYWIAVALATSYALMNYTFFRNTAHINLMYYTVPFICALTVWLGKGASPPQPRSILPLGIVALIVQSLNYIYYSFYACLLIAFATALGYLRLRNMKLVGVGAALIALCLVLSSVNLLPAFYSWHKHGAPSGLDYKRPAEAEVYGLKLRHLLSPSRDTTVPILSQWSKLDDSAAFPLENENAWSRLGLLGALGFLICLMTVLTASSGTRRCGTQTQGAVAALALFSFLVATVGGFGSLINLVVDDFRAYNRLSVFIAFYSVAALGLFLDDSYKQTGKVGSVCLSALLLLVATITVWDQLAAARPLVDKREAERLLFVEEEDIVRRMESAWSEGASFLQLPSTVFPLDAGKAKMTAYDHARPFLHSRSLRWSWPSFTTEHELWNNKTMALVWPDRIRVLQEYGFGGIWIDRYGYEDGGFALEQNLKEAGLEPTLSSTSGRWVVYDLTGGLGQDTIGKSSKLIAASSGIGTPKQASVTLNVSFAHDAAEFEFIGWSIAEASHRWTEKQVAEIIFYCDETGTLAQTITIEGFTNGSQSVTIKLNGETIEKDTTSDAPLKYNIAIPSGCLKNGANRLEFILPDSRAPENGDPRILGFALQKLIFSDKTN